MEEMKMLQREFEELAGYEVTTEDYDNVIEPMYMAVEMSKQDFVRCIDRKRFALKTKDELMVEIKKEARHLMETCEHYTDFGGWAVLEKRVKEYAKRFWGTENWTIKRVTTGDWFWKNCPGRGCEFPVAIEMYDRDDHYIGTVDILDKEELLKKALRQ